TRLTPHSNGKGERAAPVQGRQEYADKVTTGRGAAETAAGLRNLDRLMTTLGTLGTFPGCRPAARPRFARPHSWPGRSGLSPKVRPPRNPHAPMAAGGDICRRLFVFLQAFAQEVLRMLWFQVLVVVIAAAWFIAARAYLREVNRPKYVCTLPKLGWGNV